MNEWYAGKLISADKRFVWQPFAGIVAAAICAAARRQGLLHTPFGNVVALETPFVGWLSGS